MLNDRTTPIIALAYYYPSTMASMNRQVVEMFAAAYPKNKVGGLAKDFDSMGSSGPVPLPHYPSMVSPRSAPSLASSQSPSTPQKRTPIEDIITEGYGDRGSGIKSSGTKYQISSSQKNGFRKFLAILLIVFLGAFLFSSFSYTISDTIFSKFGLQFFADGGHPTMMIVVIHSLIFLALIYLIVSTLSWC